MLNHELIDQIKSVDITSYDAIHFFSDNGKSYTISLDSIKQIAVYVARKYGKATFTPGELRQERDLLVESFQSTLSPINHAQVVDTLTEWTDVGGRFEFISKIPTLLQQDNTTQTAATTTLGYQVDTPSIIQSSPHIQKIMMAIYVLLIVAVVSVIYIFTRVSSTEEKNTIPVTKIPRMLTGVTVGKNLELIDTVSIHEKNVDVNAVYHYDGDIVYSTVDRGDAPGQSIPKYYSDSKLLFSPTDSIYLYDIKDKKMTYAKHDKNGKGELYVDGKLIAKNSPSLLNFPGRGQLNFEPFNYQKIGGKDIYVTRGDLSKNYTVHVDNTEIDTNFSGHPEILVLDNEPYIIGRDTNYSIYSLYRGTKKVANSKSSNFAPTKIGSELAYQVDNKGIFELYLGNKQIAQNEPMSMTYKEVDGKIMYDVYNSPTDQTFVYLGDKIIAKIDRTKSINGLNYGEKGGKIYYSYKVFPDKSSYASTKDITNIDGQLYENINQFELVKGKLAYLRYNTISKLNDLYYDEAKIAEGVVAGNSFGEMNGELYYITYSKQEKKFHLFYNDTIINSSDSAYYFIKGKKGLYYTTINYATKLTDVYLNSTLLISGKQDVGFLKSKNDKDELQDIYVYFHPRKGLPYSIIIDDMPIALSGINEPKLVQGDYANDIFYTIQKFDEDIKIYVYHIQK